MSVRQAVLALLAQQPMYGYQLRAEFEERTGATWPLNVGQVYTTLSRLERDGLVVVDHGGAHDGEPVQAGGDRATVRYRITDLGRGEVGEWFGSPVSRDVPERDELAIKLALAVTMPAVDVAAIVQAQRMATMASLAQLSRAKRAMQDEASDATSLAQGLVLDSLVFDAEAEIRWLDHCEARLVRAARQFATTHDPEVDK